MLNVVEHLMPAPGDANVCSHCSCLSIFESDHMRKPSAAEVRELAHDPGVLHAQALADYLRATHRA